MSSWIDQLATSRHGGACCGRFHLFEFDDAQYALEESSRRPTLAEKAEGLKRIIRQEFSWGYSVLGFCVEVVLADYQLKFWRRALTSVGFKKVFDFVNINSGNRCYVFMLDTSKMK